MTRESETAMAHEEGIRPYGPGKFNSMLDAYIYDLAGNGCDEELGDVSEQGMWYGILRGIKVDGAFADVTPAAGLTDAELESLRQHPAGAILSENSQGFVHVAYFQSSEELEDAWIDCQADIGGDEGDPS